MSSENKHVATAQCTQQASQCSDACGVTRARRAERQWGSGRAEAELQHSPHRNHAVRHTMRAAWLLIDLPATDCSVWNRFIKSTLTRFLLHSHTSDFRLHGYYLFTETANLIFIKMYRNIRSTQKICCFPRSRDLTGVKCDYFEGNFHD